MRIALLSNINLDSLAKRLEGYEVYTPAGYGVWLQELMDKDSNLYDWEPNAIFLILDAEQIFNGLDFPSSVSETERIFNTLEGVVKDHGDIAFFISDIDFYSRRILSADDKRWERFVELKWYELLLKLSQSFSNVHIFNLKDLVERIGRDMFYEFKYWYLGGIKFSAKAEEILANEIEKYLKAYRGKRKKALILDLDNTLWGGVLGEEGLEGIELSEYGKGARYKDFQKRIKEIKEMGTILAVVSKNNPEDVEEVFEKHNHMVLKKEDFAIMKINWNPKPDNIREISEDLNLGMDSFVFIDDNPVEREIVKRSLPEVEVPEFPADTSKLVEFIEDVYNRYFFTLRYTEEDRKKTLMYIQNAKRAELKKSFSSMEDFLKELKTKIYVWKLKEEDIPRAAQLTQKTNQFNLTTKRYTESDLRKFMESEDYDIYIARVEDKFGDNGKVVLMIIKKDMDKKEAEIDTFLMSCRVMGRYIEDQFVDYVEGKLKEEGIERIKAYYFPTKKNKPVKELYERLGYKLINEDENGNKFYIRDLSENVERKKFAQLIEM